MSTLNLVTTQQLQCANCQAACEASELYCAYCGCILPHALAGTHQTRMLGAAQNRNIDLQWGTSYFHFRARLFLRTVDNSHVVPVQWTETVAIVGRSTDDAQVEVDLTNLGAIDHGVSRRHLKIERSKDTLYITDLESANGTFLNRVRLKPHEAVTLRNRAVLQLGQLILRIQFA